MAAQLMKRARHGRTAPAAIVDYRRLFEDDPRPLLVLAPDREFTILAASSAFLRSTASAREAIVGRGLFEAFPHDTASTAPGAGARLRGALERLVEGSDLETTAIERRDVRRPGSKRVERYCRPTNYAVRSHAGTILYLVHQLDDVTDLVRAQARSTSLSAAVEQADHELESLSYAVSHDLRASLRAIDGFSRILEEDYAERLDREGRRVLSVVRDSGARMGRQMEDVLAYSRLGRQPMSMVTVDMSHIARAAFDEACDGATAAPMLELKPLPRARGDPALLRQVWLNLLGNSVKFTAPRPHPLIDVSARRHETETIYSVRDNGVGFDMRNYGKLFGVFQRLHPEDEFPGSGIGLAIVQRLVARHGGRVWGEGVPGEGASFHFALPRGRT